MFAGPAIAAPAPDDALALIPPSAIATIQINGIARVQDRLDALLKNAVPDRAQDASKTVRDTIAEAFAGRDLQALRPDGRTLIAIADVENLPDDATLTFLFPAKSADEFRTRFLRPEERKSLKKAGDLETVQWEDRKAPFYVVNLKGYVAVTSDKATATRYAKGELGGVAKQLSADTARTFLNADVGVFVNVREVNAKYGDRLKRFKSVADLFLRGDTVQGVSQTQVEQIKLAIGAAFQVVEHGTAAVISVEFRPDGLAIHGTAQFAADTPTAAALKKYTPTALPRIGTLPAGQMTYTVDTLGTTESSLGIDTFFVADTDPAAAEKIEALRKQAAALDRGVTVSASRMTGESVEQIESKDAARIVETRLSMLRALTTAGSFAGVPLKAKPEITERAATVGGFTLTQARFAFDFDRMVADLPEDQRAAAVATARRNWHGDETSLWLGTDGKSVLQLTGRAWADAKALADAFFGRTARLDQDEAYQFTRKQLPAEATMLVMLDAAQAATSIYGMFRNPAAKDAPAPQVPPGKPAYVGLALVLRPGHGSFELFVPARAADPIRKLVDPLLDKDK